MHSAMPLSKIRKNSYLLLVLFVEGLIESVCGLVRQLTLGVVDLDQDLVDGWHLLDIWTEQVKDT